VQPISGGVDDYRNTNRAHWDEAALLHVSSPLYRTDAFRRGENVLDPIVRERIGDVAGKRLLHLQCHFGLDTLSLARIGADVTGLDFSANAIAAARALSLETGVPAHFVEADVLDPPPSLTGFDVVLASWGALGWIGDLKRWMSTASQALKSSGRLLIVEGHPVLSLFDDHASAAAPFTVRYPYDPIEPVVENIQGTYAAPQAVLKSSRTVWFSHGLGRIIRTAIAAGFVIQSLDELDRVPWHALPQLVKVDDFYWRVPEGTPSIPLAFALDARRP
jgi:SAM-dependent methyltransferase